jgi:hypothetical protein
MVEAAPQGEAFPTGENGGTWKWFGVCEICETHHRRDGVNNNPPDSLGEKKLAQFPPDIMRLTAFRKFRLGEIAT